MKKVLIVIAALSLSGCSTQFGERIASVISAAQNFTLTQGQIDSARNTYDGFVLAPLNKYAVLPRCKTGQKLTLNVPCHDRVLLKQIRSVDNDIAKAFSDTQVRIDTGDNKGAVVAYQTLMSSINLAKSLIATTGISVLGF